MIIIIKYHSPNTRIEKVILDNGEEWILKGECNRCGMCCDDMPSKYHPYIAKRGKGKGCRFEYKEVLDNVKVSACKTYWCKPECCTLFPNDPHEDLYEECSYEWERVK